MHKVLIVSVLVGALMLTLGACAPRPAEVGSVAGANPGAAQQPTVQPPTPRPTVATPTPRASYDGPPQPGQPAPDFALQNLAGEEISLADYAGQPVLVFFWATWCGYCRNEIATISAMFPELQEQGLVILSVDIMEDASVVADYAEEMGIEFPILLDADARLADRYYVRGVPTNVFIDREGVIARMFPGAPEPEQLREYVAELSG